jgi:DUF1365 family protein
MYHIFLQITRKLRLLSPKFFHLLRVKDEDQGSSLSVEYEAIIANPL